LLGAAAGTGSGILATFSKGDKEMLGTQSYGTASLVMVFTAILGLTCTASADDHAVPIKGHVDEMLTSATPEPDGVHVAAAGEGHASHLGGFTSSENAVIHPDGTVQAMVVLTAANGDQLFWTDVATLTSPTTAAGTITFTGGTGRFKDASGTAHFDAVISADGSHLSLTFEGSIRY
jgi:hypothetical protein